MGRDDETVREAEVEVAPRERWRLAIVGEAGVETRELPEGGKWVIGRAEDAEISLDSPAISRRHAILHLGARVRVEDLGSANGTRVRGARIGSGAAVELLSGDTVEIGPWTLCLSGGVAARSPKVWPRAYFSTCLAEECAKPGARLELLAIEPRASLDPAARASAMGADLRGEELLADLGGGAFAVMLLDRAPEVAGSMRRAVMARLAAVGAGGARVGSARLGEDGATGEAVLESALRAMRGEASIARSARPTMQRLERLLDRVAPGSISVLILGETGAGKEVTAQRIHERSPRAAGPFVQLNCAALSESLIESELFGFEKGAFTGAIQAKPGLLETANGGTLFLDEVGELPMSTQAKLLRVIEERRVLRVGALKPVPIDVRILSATNRDLEKEIAAGKFREDLYFRLNGISVTVPPLRERIDEIPSLADKFIRRAAEAERREPPTLTAEALALLQSHRWPGNVRELRNVLERAVLLAGDKIEAQHLPMEELSPRVAPPSGSLEGELQSFERDRIVKALEATRGNQTKAAELLGIARRTLINRLEQYGIARPRKRYGEGE